MFADADGCRRSAVLAEEGLDPEALLAGLSGMVVETEAHERVLLDGGSGGRWHPGLGQLPEALARIDCPAHAIDVVVVSHAHPDHLGGLLDERGRVRYPNARHVVGTDEWAHWTSDEFLDAIEPAWAELARDVLPKIESRLHLTSGVCEIALGVTTWPCPGHTPGHIGARISSGAETLLWVGDAFGHPLGVRYPEWSVATDMDPARAERSRHQLIGAAVALDALVFGNHFPFPAVGRISAGPAGWDWIEAS